MHRLRSITTVYRFRLLALMLCGKYVPFAIASVFLIHALIDSDQSLATSGAALMGLTVLMTVWQWLLAERTGCPLCLAPVLARKKCATHRHAKTLLGSHRLPVALDILFCSRFRCPYCHEVTALEVRAKQSRH